MQPSDSGPPATRPKTVVAAQAVLWVQFTAIVALYSIGLRYLFDATRSGSSRESMVDVLSAIGLERWVLILISTAITVAMPFIASGIGRGRAGAVRAAWWALAFVPLGMYLWIVARAYFAAFPDDAPFYVSAAAMLVICGSFPTAILLSLRSRSARAWFAAGELIEEIDRELEEAGDLVGADR